MQTEQFISIDNVCAWPNLTQCANGEILACIFNKPTHGRCEGDIDCWVSTDGGRSFAFRSHVTKHEPTTNRMNLAAGLAGNGDVLAMVSGWNNRAISPEGALPFSEATVLSPWLCRSTDGGKTWTEDKQALAHTTLDGCTNQIPFGDIMEGADGILGASIYCAENDKEKKEADNGCYFIRSEDDGKTWGDPIAIAPSNHNETAVFYAGNGRWFALARTRDAGATNLFVSEDNGATWKFSQPASLPRQHPGHLMRLNDSRLMMTYGCRSRNHYGVHIRYSSDEGATWSQPVAIVKYKDADSGYPSTIQREDGSMVTSYYHAGVECHERYHMGTIIWKLEDFAPLV